MKKHYRIKYHKELDQMVTAGSYFVLTKGSKVVSVWCIKESGVTFLGNRQSNTVCVWGSEWRQPRSGRIVHFDKKLSVIVDWSRTKTEAVENAWVLVSSLYEKFESAEELLRAYPESPLVLAALTGCV